MTPPLIASGSPWPCEGRLALRTGRRCTVEVLPTPTGWKPPAGCPSARRSPYHQLQGQQRAEGSDLTAVASLNAVICTGWKLPVSCPLRQHAVLHVISCTGQQRAEGSRSRLGSNRKNTILGAVTFTVGRLRAVRFSTRRSSCHQLWKGRETAEKAPNTAQFRRQLGVHAHRLWAVGWGSGSHPASHPHLNTQRLQCAIAAGSVLCPSPSMRTCTHTLPATLT